MSGVTGDFAGLQKLIRNMRRVAGVDQQLARVVAGPLGALAQASFDAGQSPYGDGWPALKTGGKRVLQDTGALRAGATTFSPSGKRLSASLPYYGRYQNPRLFLAASGKPPASWTKVVESHTEKAILAVMEGR